MDSRFECISRFVLLLLLASTALAQPFLVEDGQEHSALSPTGVENFHEPMKFARFYDGRSHQFDADPIVTDFVIACRDAAQKRKPEPFLALATGNLTDFQKSAALEQAALLDKKAIFIDQIPIEAVKKTAQMQNLLANSQTLKLMKQFAAEDFSKWPFWKRGDGLHHGGRAHFIAKNGEQAETDLSAALDWIGDLRVIDSVLLLLAQNRENNLKDDANALEACRAILTSKTRLGGAGEYSACKASPASKRVAGSLKTP